MLLHPLAVTSRQVDDLTLQPRTQGAYRDFARRLAGNSACVRRRVIDGLSPKARIVSGGCGCGAGVLVGAWLADRMGMRAPRWRLQIPAIGMVISIPSWAVVFTAADMPAILVALMIGAALLTFHTGPTFALVQSAVAPSMRPVAAALLLLVVSLIGLGFGPLLIGRLSEMFAARRGADSLGMALLVVPLLYAWAACHYYAAARVLRPDLEAVDGTRAEFG